MIEVEKKFQPTEEQKNALVQNAEFISKKEVRDNYYDLESFEFAKKGMWLRNRDGEWELKVYMDNGVADEIIIPEKILEKLGYSSYSDFEQFKKEKLALLGSIITTREKYKKEEMTLDFDQTDFGLTKLDIEILLNENSDESEITKATERVLSFASQFGMKEVDLPLKPVAYLEKMRPGICHAIFGNNELNKLK